MRVTDSNYEPEPQFSLCVELLPQWAYPWMTMHRLPVGKRRTENRLNMGAPIIDEEAAAKRLARDRAQA